MHGSKVKKVFSLNIDHYKLLFGRLSTRLKITDGRSPVMMTGQIFFSPDKFRFWPVKLMNIIFFFLPMEYRITLAVDLCTALSFRFLPASW